MGDVLKNISNNQAALLLRQERARLTRERLQLAGEIRQRQQRLDAIDRRLEEVNEGERVLYRHGYH